jgi:TRAP transporter TAXI family solute receptor
MRYVMSANTAHPPWNSTPAKTTKPPTDGPSGAFAFGLNPAQNIELLEAGEAKLGFVTISIALQAWNGTGIWAGKKPARSMRAVFPMYDTPFQLLVLQDSGTRVVSDMVGKRVGVGPRGGTSAAYFPQFFNTLKIAVNLVFGEWAELAAQMHRHELDVLAVGAGVPFPSRLGSIRGRSLS